MSDSGRTLSDPRDDPWAEVRRLTAALAAAEGVNGLLRIEAGNATAARKEYESAWRQSEAALAVAGRERDDARAEVEKLRAEVADLPRRLEEFRDAVLNERHQLAEAGMDGDQINAVLDLFDGLFHGGAGQAASPPQPAAGDARALDDGEIERLAKVAWVAWVGPLEGVDGCPPLAWEYLTDDGREACRRTVLAVLRAAAAPQPAAKEGEVKP